MREKTVDAQYQIKVIDSMESWASIAGTWNELLAQSVSDTIFLRWEWLFSWGECFLNNARKLFILAVYHNDELIGIAPWHINEIKFSYLKMKQIEFLGTHHSGSDYLDVFTKKKREKEVAKCLYNYLLQDCSSQWDYMMLRDIPSNSQFLLHFQNEILEKGKYCEITNGSFCPVVSLPETKEEYLAQLSPNRRQQYRRHLRVLERSGEFDHRRYATAENIESGINKFFTLGEKSRYDIKHLQFFFKNLIGRCKDKNIVQLDFLSVDGKDIAGLLHLRHKKELSMYLMAVDKDFNPAISIGNIIVGLCIENAAENRMSLYDFLKGDEPYKFHWSNNGNRTLNLYFGQKKLVPIVYSMKSLLKHAGKVVLR